MLGARDSASSLQQRRIDVARRIPAYAPVIRYLRESRGLTRRELGQRLAVPDYYVGYMEEGYRYPRPRQVAQLSQIFGWSEFEIALLADVEIPYPDWPKLTDLQAWMGLANQWLEVVDTIHRYAVAKAIMQEPTWLEPIAQGNPQLAEAIREYGFVALYDHVRSQWHALRPHPARAELPSSLEQALAAIAAPPGAFVQASPAHPAPEWWLRLTPQDQATVAAVAEGLLRARSS